MNITDKKLDIGFLNNYEKSLIEKGYPVSKWIIFARKSIEKGYTVYCYFSRSTVSRYLKVTDGKKVIKVRFSNHKPTLDRQNSKDSDIYVGVHNNGCITTEVAFENMLKFFGVTNG